MNPIDTESHLRLVLLQWMVIIAVAWLLARLGKRFGQPLAVGEILAGVLLGPSALGLIWPAGWAPLFPASTAESMQLLGKVGLILFLFQVGMEFDFRHIRTRSHTVLAVSLAGMLAPAAGGLCLGRWLHKQFAPQTDFAGFQLCICIALSITALPVLGRILLEMRLERTALGAMAISAAAIDDTVGWIGLAAVSVLAAARFHWGPLAWQAGGVLLFFLTLLYIAGPVLKWFWKRSLARVEPADASKMPSTFLAALLICLFGCCLATNALGVFSFFGAFLLGVALHEQADLVKAWRDQLSNFVMVALVPVYFTNTGLRAEIGSLNFPAAWLGCGLVLFTGAACKLLGCWAAARASGRTQREAISIAALMNTRALMGLVAINMGYDLGLLPRELFTMFVLMSLITTAMTGPILRRSLPLELRPLVPELARADAARAPAA
jgi:Kef-type K+ transport system membrane component KefB